MKVCFFCAFKLPLTNPFISGLDRVGEGMRKTFVMVGRGIFVAGRNEMSPEDPRVEGCMVGGAFGRMG